MPGKVQPRIKFHALFLTKRHLGVKVYSIFRQLLQIEKTRLVNEFMHWEQIKKYVDEEKLNTAKNM